MFCGISPARSFDAKIAFEAMDAAMTFHFVSVKVFDFYVDAVRFRHGPLH